MKFSLTYDNQVEFIRLVLNDLETEELEMSELINGCKGYYFSVHTNNYFLSKFILRSTSTEIILNNTIEGFYSLSENINFFIEEIDFNFIEFLLSSHSQINTPLETNILEAYQSYVTRYE